MIAAWAAQSGGRPTAVSCDDGAGPKRASQRAAAAAAVAADDSRRREALVLIAAGQPGWCRYFNTEEGSIPQTRTFLPAVLVCFCASWEYTTSS